MFFFGGFGDGDGVFREFGVPEDDREGIVFLVAWYKYEDYTGSAWVLFEKGGKLYEVHGSHCSCMGLENQWDPDEIKPSYLYDEVVPGKAYTSLPDEVRSAITRALNPLWELARAADGEN